jgi:hypothetical protein
VGFRAFRERGGELYSLTPVARGRERWPAAGIVDAACERPMPGLVPHRAPAAGCRCGVYAVDSLATLRRTLAHFWFWWLRAGGNVVIAAVLIWSSPGRRVIVGELRGTPGLQYRAPHMKVLALADSPAARRVAARRSVPVLALAGLELYAREHGMQLRPGGAGRQPETPGPAASARPALVARLIERLGRWARPRAPRAWTIALLVGLPLVASVHLSVFMVGRVLLALAWLLPRLLYGLLQAVTHPVETVLLAVVGVVLLLTAWVWVADLVKGVVQL